MFFLMEVTFMQIECAWCGCSLGRHEGESKEVSHGICLPCMFVQAPVAAVKYWIKRHPEDVAAIAITILAGVFLVLWLEYGVPACAG